MAPNTHQGQPLFPLWGRDPTTLHSSSNQSVNSASPMPSNMSTKKTCHPHFRASSGWRRQKGPSGHSWENWCWQEVQMDFQGVSGNLALTESHRPLSTVGLREPSECPRETQAHRSWPTACQPLQSLA